MLPDLAARCALTAAARSFWAPAGAPDGLSLSGPTSARSRQQPVLLTTAREAEEIVESGWLDPVPWPSDGHRREPGQHPRAQREAGSEGIGATPGGCRV